MRLKAVWLPALMVVAGAPAGLQARSCDSLAQLNLPRVSITLAQLDDTGAFDAAGNAAAALANLPVFCRVTAKLMPSADSDIRAEIWLPIAGWNGKFLAIGNGGWGGTIVYGGMAEALRRGYATSSTDDGNNGPGAKFIMGHPEKFVDFGYRAEHEMSVTSKALIQAFYGRQPRHSYWNGCSGGGREGLLQAYRYPSEFDGIIAGDPANLRRNAWQLWVWRQAFGDADAVIPSAKLPMIHRAVLAACDANDGLRDGLIEAPESCHFDYKTLECAGSSNSSDCLTPSEAQTAQALTSPRRRRRARPCFPASSPGLSSNGHTLREECRVQRTFSSISSAMSFIRIQTGTGEPSISSGTSPRQMR